MTERDGGSHCGSGDECPSGEDHGECQGTCWDVGAGVVLHAYLSCRPSGG